MNIIKQNIIDYFGKPVPIYISSRENKKFYVINPEGKKVHFGDSRYSSFEEHRDKARRKAYLARATAIKGDWKKDKYSPNNLAIHLLWGKN